MMCSPGVWDVNVNLPSELYTYLENGKESWSKVDQNCASL